MQRGLWIVFARRRRKRKNKYGWRSWWVKSRGLLFNKQNKRYKLRNRWLKKKKNKRLRLRLIASIPQLNKRKRKMNPWRVYSASNLRKKQLKVISIRQLSLIKDKKLINGWQDLRKQSLNINNRTLINPLWKVTPFTFPIGQILFLKRPFQSNSTIRRETIYKSCKRY